MRQAIQSPDRLPFIAGKASLVKKMAEQHHAVSHDPNTLFLSPHRRGELSWKQILDAGYLALEKTGREIAEATTEAEVAAASLRQRTYLDGIENVNAALLGAAVKILALEPVPELEADSLSGLVAFGRRTISGQLEAIPRSHWEAGTMDWEKWQLTVSNGTIWFGVRILDLADLPLDDAMLVAHPLEEAKRPEACHEKPRNVPEGRLRQFLAERVASLRPGEGLSARALWEDAKAEFADHTVTRNSIRKWMDAEMPDEKRFSRGGKVRKPQARRTA